MKLKAFVLALALSATCALTAGVVSVDRPELIFKGAKIAQLAKAKFTATRVGSFFTPGPLQSTRVTSRKSIYGGPALHVELQCEDAGALKCLVLELTDGKDGVYGWVISSTYLRTTEAKLGAEFEQADGRFIGKANPAVTSDKAPGYGLRDLKIVK